MDADTVSGALWGLVIVGGPLALLLVLIWAVKRNRTSPAEDRHTEQATRDLYREEDRRADDPAS